MFRTTIFTFGAGALVLAGCAIAPGPDNSLPPATPTAAVAQPSPVSATAPEPTNPAQEPVNPTIAPLLKPLPDAPPEIIGAEAPQAMPRPM